MLGVGFGFTKGGFGVDFPHSNYKGVDHGLINLHSDSFGLLCDQLYN